MKLWFDGCASRSSAAPRDHLLRVAIERMTLQDFDLALRAHSASDGNDWSDDGVVLLGAMAAELDDEDLIALCTIWPERSVLWQKHLAEVLDQARYGQAIRLLLEMVGGAERMVALAALESLRSLDLSLFSEAQIRALAGSIEVMLQQPIGPLRKALIEDFLAHLHLNGGRAG